MLLLPGRVTRGEDNVPSVGALERAGDARPGGGPDDAGGGKGDAATKGDCKPARAGPGDEVVVLVVGGFENLKRLLVRPASSSAPRGAGGSGGAGDEAGGGAGTLGVRWLLGEAPRLPDT